MTSQENANTIEQRTAAWASSLLERGWFRVAVETPQGKKRLTFLVTEEEGERELMVAAEGGGCLFVDFSLNRINWFLFVSAGFDLVLSHAATDILTAVLQYCATAGAYQPDTLLLPKET